MRIRMLVADLDGTLTESRGGFRIPLEAIEAARRLEEAGILLSIVSANAMPVLAGIARYLGVSGPVIGETACVAFYRENIHILCEKSARPGAELVEREFRGDVRPSWQNRYRHYDFAYRINPGREPSRIAEAIKARLREAGLDWISVEYSGYALHLLPVSEGKARGLRAACRLAGIKPGETAAIGDSSMDRALLEAAGLSIAVGDADDELKEIADMVVDRPAGYGFAEAVDILLEKYL